MNLIDRVKSILLTPNTEWQVINNESGGAPSFSFETGPASPTSATPVTPQSLLTSYVIPLVLIGTVASFIGYGLLGRNLLGGIGFGVMRAIVYFVASVGGYYLSTYIIDALAPSFGSEKNINKSAQLVAYSYTASWIAGIFNILPMLGILAIVGLYSFYLLYLGMPILKKTPEANRVGYFVVSLLVMLVAYFVIAAVLGAILGGIFIASAY